MPANVYECLFLLNTSRVAGDAASAEKQLHTMLEKHSCEILVSRPWDERRLSYPIKHQKKALYFLIYFRTDTKNLIELGRDFRLNEMILRHMVQRIPTKLVDTMVAAAKGEHLVQNIPDEVGSESSSPPIAAAAAAVE